MRQESLSELTFQVAYKGGVAACLSPQQAVDCVKEHQKELSSVRVSNRFYPLSNRFYPHHVKVSHEVAVEALRKVAGDSIDALLGSIRITEEK